MKKRGKILAPLLVATLLSSSPILALENSEEASESISDSSISFSGISPEGEEKFWSKENLDKLDKKVESLQQQNLNIPVTHAGDVVLNTPQIYQENDYYCVPACAQILIKYVTGSNLSQSYLAGLMGTTSGVGTYIDVAQVQIAKLTGAPYELGNNSYTYFYNNMVADINANYPVIYSVNPYVFNNGSPSIGHAIVGNGYGNGNLVWFWDVNGSLSTGLWNCSAAEMSSALNANDGYYIF